jgi:predicted RNA methylase
MPPWGSQTKAVGVRYLDAALRACPERKTGVKRAEVVTTRLVQDERGWLRLAG